MSVVDIAARAGVSEGLLYHYFPTKQALVVAAIRRAADSFIAALEAVSGPTPLERLASGLAAYLDHVQDQPTGWRALLQATTGELGAIGEEVEARSRALVLDGLGVEEPSPALLVALAGWAQLERGVCVGWLDHPEMPRQAVEDLLFSTFEAALAAAARHDPTAAAALARLSAG